MEVPRHWRLKKQRYALMGETCPHCKSHLFPPREICPVCQNGARETAGAVLEQAILSVGQPLQPINR